MSDDNCLDAAGAEGPVKLVRCHGMGGNQAWVYNKMDKYVDFAFDSEVFEVYDSRSECTSYISQNKILFRSIRHVNTARCLGTGPRAEAPKLEHCRFLF